MVMAISFVSAASTASNTIALPTHTTGDMILIAVRNEDGLGAPALESGFTNIESHFGGAICGWRIAYKIAASEAETSGTWGTSNRISSVVYRGIHTASPVGATQKYYITDNNTLT